MAKEQYRVSRDAARPLEVCRQAEELFKELVQLNSSDAGVRRQWAVPLRDEAHFAKLAQQPDEATRLYETSIAAFEQAADNAPPSRGNLQTYTETVREFAQYLPDRRRRCSVSLSRKRAAVLKSILINGQVSAPVLENQLAFVYYRIGSAREVLGQTEDAISAFKRSIDLFDLTTSQHFVATDAPSTLANCYAHLGDLYQRSNSRQQATVA